MFSLKSQPLFFKKKRKKIKKLLIVNFLVFLFLDLSFGVTYRYSQRNDLFQDNSNRVGHQYFHHGFVPNTSVTYSYANYELYNFNVDSLGFRNKKNQHNTLNSKKKRFLIIGDSFAEGIGLPYEETFYQELEKKFDTSNIEFINGGVASMSPKLYYLRLKYLFEFKKIYFDHLIIMIDISDIQDEIVYKSFQPNGTYDYLPKEKDLPPYYFFGAENISLSLKLITLLTEKVALRKRNEGFPWKDKVVERERWTVDNKIYNNWGKEGLLSCEYYINEIISLCSKNGVKSIGLSVHPWPFQIIKKDKDSLQVKFWKSFCHRNNLYFVNHFDVFFNEPNALKNLFLPEDEHWNKKGHKLIAKGLSEVVVEMIKNPDI